MCVSYPAPQYILYVLAVIIPDTLDSRRWKNSPPVSMPCVDVLRPGRKALMWSPRSSTISRSGVRKDLKARSTELSTLAWAMARKKLSA